MVRWMLIGRDKEYVEIVERERIPGTLPTPGDVRVEVTVRLQDFMGKYDQVWLSRPCLVDFVREFETLIKRGFGKVSLEAMSPDELRLEIEQSASKDHFHLHVRLLRYQYSRATTRYWPTSVEGGFEVPSGNLPIILTDFKVLVG